MDCVNIKGTFAYHQGFRDGIQQAKYMYANQIERDRPKKPFSFCDGMNTKFCQNCEKEKYQFCPALGQRIDWSE